MRAMAPAGSYSTENDDAYISTGKVAWNNADDFETKLEKIISTDGWEFILTLKKLGQNSVVQVILN